MDENDEMDIEEINDDEWINKYKKEEAKYDFLYKKEVSSINIFFIYVNANNEIENKIKKEKYIIINKSINKKILKEIIKQHEKYDNDIYILNSILKYNITLNPDEIEDFINNENENDYINNINLYNADADADTNGDDILFENTIDFFKDLNAIYIIYTKLAQTSKRIKLTKRKRHLNKYKNKNKTSKNQRNLKII
jgi:hypothetical protein